MVSKKKRLSYTDSVISKLRKTGLFSENQHRKSLKKCFCSLSYLICKIAEVIVHRGTLT